MGIRGIKSSHAFQMPELVNSLPGRQTFRKMRILPVFSVGTDSTPCPGWLKLSAELNGRRFQLQCRLRFWNWFPLLCKDENKTILMKDCVCVWCAGLGCGTPKLCSLWFKAKLFHPRPFQSRDLNLGLPQPRSGYTEKVYLSYTLPNENLEQKMMRCFSLQWRFPFDP